MEYLPIIILLSSWIILSIIIIIVELKNSGSINIYVALTMLLPATILLFIVFILYKLYITIKCKIQKTESKYNQKLY